MSGSEMVLPPIDLAKPVSIEQFNVMGELLAHALNRFGRGRGWCNERHPYFQGILSNYSWEEDSYGNATVAYVPETNSETDYVERVRIIRGRLLWWFNQSDRINSNYAVTLGEVNEILTRAGIPEFPRESLEEVPKRCACGTSHESSYRVPLVDTADPTWLGDVL